MKARNVFLTDSSATMLSYSEHWRGPNVELLLADAEHLPFPDANLDLLVSILGDPYNTERFWQEASRTLKRGAHVIYTTPSHEWSLAYRGGVDRAVFDRKDDDDLALSSFVLSPVAQQALIERAGLALRRQLDVPLHELTGSISPKLRVLPTPKSAVVTGYLAAKPGR
jgi:SAM-dependent methyltransferase